MKKVIEGELGGFTRMVKETLKNKRKKLKIKKEKKREERKTKEEIIMEGVKHSLARAKEKNYLRATDPEYKKRDDERGFRQSPFYTKYELEADIKKRNESS